MSRTQEGTEMGRMLFHLGLTFLQKKKMKRTRFPLKALFSLMLVCLLVPEARGQKWSISTNLLQYVNFLTLNAEAGISVDRHWSISVAGRYNPFTFHSLKDPEKQIQNRCLSLSANARYWPFFVYSGFFCNTRLQWTEYSAGGIFSETKKEGDAFGAGFSLGYSLLITKFFNLEFGAGFWTGINSFIQYACPRCGEITDSGTRWFIAPDSIAISLLFTF